MKMKRIRNKAVRRWTKEDVSTFLETIRYDGEQIEKPSAEVYYENVAEEKPTLRGYGWKAMRDKLRNLKAKYKQVIDWMANTAVSLDAETREKTIEEYILKVCPEFEIMDEIFSGRISGHLMETESCSVQTRYSPEADSKPVLDVIVPEDEDLLMSTRCCTPSRTTSASIKEPPKGTLWSRTSHNSTVSLLAEVQKSRTQYLNDKLLLEQKIHDDEMELKREQLQLEKDKMSEEIRLNELDLIKKYELQKIEMEKRMELMKYELDLKYRVVNK